MLIAIVHCFVTSLKHTRKRVFGVFEKRFVRFKRIYALRFSCTILGILAQRCRWFRSYRKDCGNSGTEVVLCVGLDWGSSLSDSKALFKVTTNSCAACRGLRKVDRTKDHPRHARSVVGHSPWAQALEWKHSSAIWVILECSPFLFVRWSFGCLKRFLEELRM